MQQNSEVTFLKGRRVNLRPVEAADVPLFARWVNDPRIRDYIINFLPMTLIEEEDWVRKLGDKKPDAFVMTIVTKEGQPIGNMGVHRVNWRDRHCTTGALIGEPAYWNKGYGTEAKLLLLKHLFDSLNLHKVCSQAIAFNKRSIAYSLKCGYREEGRLKNHVFRRGRYWDLVNLAVFRPSFERVWKRHQRGLR